MPTLSAPDAAEAAFATGGSGRFINEIDWFEWAGHGVDIADGTVKTNSRTINGKPLATTCQITETSGPIQAYRPGSWYGDALDDLYNVGGTGGSNNLISGIVNKVSNARVSFKVNCDVTYDGVPVPIQGLVFADAESSGDTTPRDEWIAVRPLDTSNPTWRIIDRLREGCATQTLAELNSAPGRLVLVNNDKACGHLANPKTSGKGPMAVTFAEGSSNLHVDMQGAARTAVALGVVLNTDFGDAPQSYGDAGAFYQPKWQGGVVPNGQSTPVSTNFALASMNAPDLMLGKSITSEPSPLFSADAAADQGDDGVSPPSSLDVTPGTDYTLNDIECQGTGFISGWVDWNGNGTFDQGEMSDTVACPASGPAALKWSVPADAKSGASFMRLRIAADAAEIQSPTGMSMTGEVEDYAVNVALPELEIKKSSDATENSRIGDTVTYTVTTTNVGRTDFTDDYPAAMFDDLTQVLDDADLDEASIAVSPNVGTVGFDSSSSRIAWTGPLPAGESVTLTYEVTLKHGGDRNIDNVAFVTDPTDPNPPTPECDPASSKVACTEALLPALEITKAASRASLPKVGEELTYTVSVKNVGPGAYTAAAPASMTDDLTDVLDDAELVGTPSASVGTAAVSGNELTWAGPLGAGETATITYTVKYTGNGNHQLDNTACVPASEVAAGGERCDDVQVPAGNLTFSKESVPSDSPLVAGSTVKYTLWFDNDGKASADVDHTDLLTYVLDDADVTVEPAPGVGDLTATRTNDRIRIVGNVPAGERYSVTYTVTLKADGARGDNLLVNHLLEGDPTDPPNPPDPTDPCVSTTTTTCNPVGELQYTKAVSYDSPLGDGSELTYTVTIVNNGQATAPVSREDVLTEVLDDANLSSEPASDTVSVTVTPVTNERFTMGGNLAAGQTAKVTYSVKLKPQAERGNNRADNFLVTPGDTPPAECEADSSACTSTPLPVIDPSKSVDPASGTTVTAGNVLTYTLRFENTGAAAGAVDYTDVLSGILDDAELVGSPQASDPALTPNLTANETLVVTGELAPGQVATVTYQVKVKPDGQRGDNHLGNFLVKTPSVPTDPIVPGDCDAASKMCTENPVAEIVSWKSVVADEEPVQAGTKLTYTLHFENIGKGSGEVNWVDDLTHVTDDADVTTEPSGTGDLEAERNGNQITITGPLEAGTTETVTYQVTARADGDRGDDIAANFLLKPDEEGNLPPTPTDPVCQPADSDRPDCTVTPIGKLLSTKSVSASTDPVATGTVLTYTLTFDNQGKGPVKVDQTDILTDVLDDATVTTQPQASDGVLSTTEIADGEFRTTGTLAAGQTVTVTYEVTVNPEAERGNNSANNFLVPTGEEPPTECNDGDATCTQTPLPRILGGKSADPTTHSTVVAGEEITYTLTFTNDGEAAGTLDYTDDLTGVLDDAALVGTPATSVSTVVASSGTDGAIRVTGTLQPAETVTVTYTVKVKDDGKRGDNLLKNAITKTGTETCDAIDGSSCMTEHPVPEVTVAKSANPSSGTPLVAGQEVEYTLTFKNTGKATGTIAKVDDLSHVLDDADVTSEPKSSSPQVSADRVDNLLAIGGTIKAGETVTVSYTVKVKAEQDRGDSILANFVLNPGEDTPPDSTCDVTSQVCTTHPVGQVSAVKTVNPKSGSEVRAGDTLTYTLSFENTGTGPAAVAYTDYLADVLDDAEFVGTPVASEGLTAAREGNIITVNGALAPAATGTVTYKVKVKEYTAQGNHQLQNFLTPEGVEPPTECVVENPLCTQNPIKPPAPGLTATGSQGMLAMAAIGITILLAGGALLLVRRRKEQMTS